MDFALSSERQILFDTLTKYFKNEYPLTRRNKAAVSELGFSDDSWKAIASLGIFEAIIKPNQGGFGGEAIDIITVFETLGSGLVIEPILNSALLCSTVLSYGSEQHQSIIKQIIDCESRPIFSHYEDMDQYELASIQTSATSSEDGFLINGHKSATKHLVGASHLIFSARTSGEVCDENGISLFLIPIETNGITFETFESIDGGRVSDLRFTNVRVKENNLIGPLDDAFSIVKEATELGTLALCAEALGIMEKIKNITLDYLKTRKQFGVPIGKFQTLQHRMTQLLIEIEQARSAVMNASFWFNGDQRNKSKYLAAAKYTIGRAGTLIAEESIQMHGGMGMTWEYDLGHFAKRLIIINHEFGDDDYQLRKYVELT